MTAPVEKGRRKPKFRRVTTDDFEWNPKRDPLILGVFAKHRFATARHVAAVVVDDRDAGDDDAAAGDLWADQWIRKRVGRLFHHGDLDKPREQRGKFKPGGGSYEVVYGLSNQGAEEARGHGYRVSGSNWSDLNRRAKHKNIRHTLGITEFMVLLEAGCRRRGDRRLIEDWAIVAKARTLGAPVPKRNPLKFGRRLPDTMFALLDAASGEAFLCFHEFDTAAMPGKRTERRRRDGEQTDFYDKLAMYYETWLAWSRKDGPPTPYGFQHFRVFTVTTSPARVANLVQKTRELTGGAGAGLFLFTDRDTLRGTAEARALVGRFHSACGRNTPVTGSEESAAAEFLERHTLEQGTAFVAYAIAALRDAGAAPERFESVRKFYKPWRKASGAPEHPRIFEIGWLNGRGETVRLADLTRGTQEKAAPAPGRGAHRGGRRSFGPRPHRHTGRIAGGCGAVARWCNRPERSSAARYRMSDTGFCGVVSARPES